MDQPSVQFSLSPAGDTLSERKSAYSQPEVFDHSNTSKGIWSLIYPIIIKNFENAPLLSALLNQLYTCLIFYLYYKN